MLQTLCARKSLSFCLLCRSRMEHRSVDETGDNRHSVANSHPVTRLNVAYDPYISTTNETYNYIA